MRLDPERFGAAVARVVKQALVGVADRVTGLEARVSKLESGAGNNQRAVDLEMRIRALENRPTFTYRGTWEAGTTYTTGDFVTWGGSMWHCSVSDSSGIEPNMSARWKLAVMRGRQGKQGDK